MSGWCFGASFEARPAGSHLRMREVCAMVAKDRCLPGSYLRVREVCAMGAEYQYHAGFHLKVGEVCADLPHPEVRVKRSSKDAS
jgi:hypothetical protein